MLIYSTYYLHISCVSTNVQQFTCFVKLCIFYEIVKELVNYLYNITAK